MSISTSYQNHSVHWTIFGRGKRLLIALHGFGDRGSTFQKLNKLETNFTIYVPDLPYHGKTDWQSPSYTAEDIYQILQQALIHSGHQRFSIMGHSYGARIILCLLPRLQAQLDHIFLLAPDGIQGRSGRAARLTPLWLRRLCVRIVEPPDRLFAGLKIIGAKYWLPKQTYEFIHLHLARPHRRKRTFNTWLSMVHFHMEPRKARKRLREAALPTDVFVGLHDHIIPPSTGRFLLRNNPTVSLHILDADHHLVGTILNANDYWNTI